MVNTSLFKASPFNIKLELINQLVPMIFIAGVIAELYFAIKFNQDEKRLINFVSQIVFLNLLHVSFTFILIFSVPEFKAYLYEKSQQLNYRLDRRWRLIFVLLIFFFATLFFLPEYLPALKKFPEIALLPFLIVSLSSFYHNIRQSVGVSIMHYFNTENYAEVQKSNIISLEKQFTKILIFSVLAIMLSQTLLNQNYKLYVLIFLVFFLLFKIINILIKIFKVDIEIFKLRILFFCRYFFFLLAPVSTLALAGGTNAHGLEYLMVFEKIVSNKKTEKIRMNSILIFGLMLYLVLMYVGLKHNAIDLFINIYLPKDKTALAVHTLMSAISCVHFYIDGFLYKFKDPIVLKNQMKCFV